MVASVLDRLFEDEVRADHGGLAVLVNLSRLGRLAEETKAR